MCSSESSPQVLLRIKDEVYSVRLPRPSMTAHELALFWESEWSIRYATRIRFEAPSGSNAQWMTSRTDHLPLAPSVISLHCTVGSILQSLTLRLKQEQKNTDADSQSCRSSNSEGISKANASTASEAGGDEALRQWRQRQALLRKADKHREQRARQRFSFALQRSGGPARSDSNCLEEDEEEQEPHRTGSGDEPPTGPRFVKLAAHNSELKAVLQERQQWREAWLEEQRLACREQQAAEEASGR
mmetsp:Transcript_2461/g.5315  ORF Transcript_2461/g.5315 Transcript_2461/m.5315 type:complete len:244 (-) Transcript_2461:3-734(-)